MPVDADDAASADDPFDNISASSEVTGEYSKVSEFTMEREESAAAAAAALSPAIEEEPGEPEAKSNSESSSPSKQQEEGIKGTAQQVVGKAREASSAAIKSVVKYENEHHIVEKVLTKAQQSARFVASKVKECTAPAKDTTTTDTATETPTVATGVHDHEDVPDYK